MAPKSLLSIKVKRTASLHFCAFYRNIKCIFFFCGGTFQENQVAEIQAQKLPDDFVQWVNHGDTFWY